MTPILDVQTVEAPPSPVRRGPPTSAAAPGAPGVSHADEGLAMTAEESADLVRQACHAFNTADLDLFTLLSSDDLTWETPGQSPIAGLRKGREAVYGQSGTYLVGPRARSRPSFTTSPPMPRAGWWTSTATPERGTAGRSTRCAASPPR